MADAYGDGGHRALTIGLPALADLRTATREALARPKVEALLTALVVAGAGGAFFTWLGLPLAWMLGAMLATTLAGVLGLRVDVPAWLRSPVIAVLGVLLGSSFDQQSLLGLWRWLPSLGLMTVYTAVTTLFSIFYLHRVARLDAQTAYFCATPGGLGIMVILGDRMGGDLLTITLVHAVRVLLVVFTIPLALSLFEGLHVPPIADAVQEASPYELGLMLVSVVTGSALGVALRLPAPTMLGPMLTTAAAHVVGLMHGAPPPAAVALTQVVVGGYVGCRFRGVDPVRLVVVVVQSIGLTLAMLLVALLFVIGLSWLTGLPPVQLMLAFVPGGVAEMSLMALALHADATFVATHHIVRLTLVTALAAPLYEVYARRVLGRQPSPGDA